MRIQVRRYTGEVVVVEVEAATTAAQIATLAAIDHGFGAFDAAWCLGEGETFIQDGHEASAKWVPMVAPAEALDEETEYLLAVLPASLGGLN